MKINLSKREVEMICYAMSYFNNHWIAAEDELDTNLNPDLIEKIETKMYSILNEEKEGELWEHG